MQGSIGRAQADGLRNLMTQSPSAPERDRCSRVAERMRGANPTSAHEALAELTPERVYTTNYDCLLERILAPDESLVWVKDSDLARTDVADDCGIYR